MNVLENIRSDLRTRFPALHGISPHALALAGSQPSPPPPRADPTAIILGLDAQKQPVGISLVARLEHLFVLGVTGSGKSNLLLHYMRQAIKLGEGGLFLDPHGSHPDSGYSSLLSWLAKRDRRVHIFDFNATTHTVGFNPLACPPGTDVSVIAGNVLDALAVSWEGESFAQKPTIERNMTVAFSTLAELGLTLVEAPMLFDHADEHGLRAYAIQNIQDRYTRDELKRLQDLARDSRRKRDFDQETVGPLNRLQRLLRPPAIRAMLGQTSPILDMQAAMDNGDIILANLSGGSRAYERDADLFGRLLVRMTLFHAKRRKNNLPFTMMLDEAHRFLSSDVPTLLGEVRKYGVSVVSAMQWLEQASTHDENILAALLKGTNCKICFRLRDAKESEQLAGSLVPLDLEQPVAKLMKPTVILHNRRKFASESASQQEAETASTAISKGETDGEAETLGETEAESDSNFGSVSDARSISDMSSASHGIASGNHSGASAGTVMTPTGDYWHPEETSSHSAGEQSGASAGHSSSVGSGTSRNVGTVDSRGSMSSSSYARSRAATRSFARSRAETQGKAQTRATGQTKGFSEGLEPLMAWLPGGVHSKDNMLYKAGLTLRNLSTGVAFVSYVGKAGAVATFVTVPHITSDPVSPEALAAERDRMIARSPAAIPADEAMAHIAEREAELTARKIPEDTKPRKSGFKQPRGERRW
jgi:hypothetical protein